MRNYWIGALTISLLAHVAIFSESFPKFFKNTPKEKVHLEKKQEIRELQMSPQKIDKLEKKKSASLNEAKPLPYIEDILSKLIEKDNSLSLKKLKFFDKNEREIIFSEIPALNNTLNKNSAYMNYYRLIREKIRKSTYSNYRSNKKGEILLSFLLFNNGGLKDITLNKKSTKSELLRNVALKSIKESAPFPAFPVELKKYSQLRFNISIYFKNN